MQPDIATLVEAARKARTHAYAPYSRFAVGAAVRTASGKVYCGCNVENASYGLSLCAERAAIAAAIAAGEREIVALAVVADTGRPVPPCGMCRQVMVEFNPRMQVILCSTSGETEVTTAEQLLPGPFTPEHLPR
ncbi:MAG: cytidine deaminase [Chloroflexia bacterium]